MLYDLDAHRRKGVLFALGLDHNVGRSAPMTPSSACQSLLSTHA
jgi:hypothetical protein